MRLSRMVAVSVLTFGAVACGGNKPDAKATSAEVRKEIDADPVALLPGQALVAGSVDAKTFFASPTVGAQLAQLVEKNVPIGEEAGFRASRDVDRVVFASYSLQGADVVAVLVGRFDEAKVKAFAASRGPTKGGGALVASQYAGRDVYTVSNVGFTVLTPRAALVGTEAGMRRALDRVRDNRLARDIPPWMIQTMESPGAAVGVAADVAAAPQMGNQGFISLGFLQGLKTARVLADFKAPGFNVAASLSYADERLASAAVADLNNTGRMTNMLALVGAPQIRNLEVKADKADAQLKFGVDEAALRGILARLQ